MSNPKVKAGNKVLFVGGPSAGDVRLVPEEDMKRMFRDEEGDYMYKIWPFSIPGDKRTVYFAYAANQHPINMLIDLWREYSPAAQIQRGTSRRSYQKLQDVGKKAQ